MAAQESLNNLIPMAADIALPKTPQPSHATIDGLNKLEKAHSNSDDSVHLTPPPSTQAARKGRTPTPTYSSISTPPPTLDTSSQTKQGATFAAMLDSEDLASTKAEDLRSTVVELQNAYQEAKMNAAHYKLQYEMLAQESAAAIERMAVEARMAQHENDVIYAEQAKASTTPNAATYQAGMIPVQKDLYQSMCLEIQHLTRIAQSLHHETRRQEKIISDQENEIESLAGRVTLMKDRIRANREALRRMSAPAPHRDAFATPSRRNAGQDQFAALLQASEMASQEAKSARRKPTKHVTMTPQRYKQPATYTTPSRQPVFAAPATAPVQRTEIFPPQPVYAQVPKGPPGPRSEDTVSNSDREVDSEAETDIIDADGDVAESQASRAASLMLRSSQEGSFHGIKPAQPAKLKQTRLFGAIRKPGVDREDERPTKRARTGDAVGLGIVNART